VILIALAVVGIAPDTVVGKPTAQPLAIASGSLTPYIRDSVLVQVALDQARNCMASATIAMENAATQEVLALVAMSLDGAANQEILDYAAASANRLSEASNPWATKARVWLDDVLYELERRHGSRSHGYGEIIGAAGITMDSEYLTRARIRLSEIFLVAELLTR